MERRKKELTSAELRNVTRAYIANTMTLWRAENEPERIGTEKEQFSTAQIQALKKNQQQLRRRIIEESNFSSYTECMDLISVYDLLKIEYERARYNYSQTLYITESLFLNLCETVQSTTVMIAADKACINKQSLLYQDLLKATGGASLDAYYSKIPNFRKAMTGAQYRLEVSYRTIQAFNEIVNIVSQLVEVEELQDFQIPVNVVNTRIEVYNDTQKDLKEAIHKSGYPMKKKVIMLAQMFELYPPIDYSEWVPTKAQRTAAEKFLTNRRNHDSLRAALIDPKLYEILGVPNGNKKTSNQQNGLYRSVDGDRTQHQGDR